MNIKEAQEEVDQWIKTIGVRYFSELTNLAVLTEEVGELARLISRKYGDQSFKEPKTEHEVQQAIEEELADILFVTICLANQMDIDLTNAFQNSLVKKTKRDQHRHKENTKLYE